MYFFDLTAILRNDEPAGSSYQQTFDLEWEDFDFAHVPVGLLSQVYEEFSWKWDPHAKDTSVHYTPRRIANYVVEEAFAGLPKAESARVLDPACGAGVFLVLAFRKLYQARWKSTQVRPDTKEIRQILEKQITGFDVSESALRLAALSLYLTAIELDPEPVPPSKLRFKALRDRVLFNWRRKAWIRRKARSSEALENMLGRSIAEPIRLCSAIRRGRVCREEEKTKKKRHVSSNWRADFTKLSRDVLVRRGLPELAKGYRNPDRIPDLPFVWRSLEWCEANGRIGLVLPWAYSLQAEQQTKQCPDLQEKRYSVPWQSQESLTAQIFPTRRCGRRWGNRSCCSLHRIGDQSRTMRLRFVTPHCDVDLNGRGEIRIDSKSDRASESSKPPLPNLGCGSHLPLELRSMSTSLEK